MKRTLSLIILSALGLIIGFLLGKSYVPNKNIRLAKIQPADSKYHYIAPILAVDLTGPQKFSEYKSLESSLTWTINSEKNKGHISDAALYFRNLQDGTWVGINEDQQYHPASMFKVPIMIAYYKQSEDDPNVLKKMLKFDNPADKSAPQLIPPKESLQFGNSYSVDDLINRMIIYSDNDSANILAEGIAINQEDAYTEMLGELGLPVDAQEISPERYSMFLRILYNSTYLNHEMSEKALQTLAKADFKDGLVKGVPDNVEIAHKFGEYGSKDSSGQLTEELHDCGIIYASKPYLLCIMTKGDKVEDLENLIGTLSKAVYDDITK